MKKFIDTSLLFVFIVLLILVGFIGGYTYRISKEGPTDLNLCESTLKTCENELENHNLYFKDYDLIIKQLVNNLNKCLYK